MFALREGKWRTTPEPPALGHDPQGKVLGILGMGGIGRNMKRKCEAFGVETIYHNRTRLSEEMAAGAKWVEFNELLAKADVLSLNLPLNVSFGISLKWTMVVEVADLLTDRKTLATLFRRTSLPR
jgi:D-3-phosphoglycerate dehydrogenase